MKFKTHGILNVRDSHESAVMEGGVGTGQAQVVRGHGVEIDEPKGEDIGLENQFLFSSFMASYLLSILKS